MHILHIMHIMTIFVSNIQDNMATINLKQRKAVDLPADAIRSLAVQAAALGTSVKHYMETILLSQAEKINAGLIKNPSPSGDPYFSDPRNIARILEASKQIKDGQSIPLTPELKDEIFGDL